MSKNLRYQVVSLIVPWREGEQSEPENWNWQDLADTVEPLFVGGGDTLPAGEAREVLRTNGLAHLADEVVPDEGEVPDPSEPGVPGNDDDRHDLSPDEQEDADHQKRLDAAADVSEALEKLYRACDGDGMQVGEIMHECLKVASINYHDDPKGT